MTSIRRNGTSDRPKREFAALTETLALAFPHDVAARLAPNGPATSIEPGASTRSAVAAAIWRYRLERVRTRLARTSIDNSTAPPLGSHTGLTAHQAISCALFAGGLSVDQIADVVSVSVEQAVEHLAGARRHLLPDNEKNGCVDFRHLVDRSFDRDFPAHERLALRHHLRECRDCQAAMCALEAVDESLRGAIDSIDTSEHHAPTGSVATRWPRASGTLASAALALLLLALVATAVAGFDHALGLSGGPIALAPPHESPRMTGWIVTSTIDGLAAINLATREHRVLARAPRENNRPPVTLLSPDGKQIAVWRFHDDQRVTTSLEVTSVNGDVIGTWSWDRSTSLGRLTAWLDNDELLFVRPPAQQPGESTQDFVLRQTEENHLVTLDIHSRDVRHIFTGAIGIATASPDARSVAILGIYVNDVPETSGRSLELRQFVNGKLGPSNSDRALQYPLDATRPIWSADSTQLFFTLVDDTAGPVESRSRQGGRVDIAVMDLTGDLRVLTNNVDHERIRLLGVSPDASNYLYIKTSSSESPVVWNLWRGYMDHRDHDVLASDVANPFFYSATATWLPDGRTAIVNESQSHYLTGDANPRAVPVGATRFLTISGDVVETISTELGVWGIDAWGEQILRWLPEDAVAANKRASTSSAPILGDFSEPRPVEHDIAARVTAPWSVVDPHGNVALYQHRMISVPMLWRLVSESGRMLSGNEPPGDISWTSGGDAVIAVQNDAVLGSRMVFYAVQSSRVANFYDFRALDPAGIASDPATRYATPRLAPDGNTASYAIVNEAELRVDVWLASIENGHQPAIGWSWPPDSQVTQPLLAVWTTPETLLLALPAEWEAGIPRAIELVQLTLTEGSTTAERKVTFHAPGSARGITLEQMAFSPDGARLALRIRHYNSLDPSRDHQDIVLVADTHDGRQQVELARGSAGSGLAWSPDSQWLAFGIRDRIAVARFDGRDLAYVSQDGDRARDPMWTSSGTIHYTTGPPGESARMFEIVAR